MQKTEIKLDYPVDVDGVKYETISIRRPKVRDQINSQKSSQNSAEQEIAMLVDISETPEKVFHEMDLGDYGKFQDALLGFMKGRKA